jgi:transposase
MEATGRYERSAHRLLAASGFPVAVVNPRKIRALAGALGKLEKTEKIDSWVIAQYGQLLDVQPTHVPTSDESNLQSLVTRRLQLVRMRAKERCRLKHPEVEQTESLEHMISSISAEIDRIEGMLNLLIQSDPQWQARSERLRTMPGVGAKTAALLGAMLPELGSLNGKEIAKLVGVAPINHDSGTLKGKRAVAHGRAEVRSALYMGALTASRKGNHLYEFKLRLKAKDKPGKVVQIAVVRKMLVALNAMVRDGQDFFVAPVPQTQVAA